MQNFLRTDSELWAAIRQDDEKAFAELFDRYWVSLYRTAVRYVKDEEASEEIVHDIFLALWNRRKVAEDIISFSSYLLAAVRYRIYSRARSSKLHITHLDEAAMQELMQDRNKGEDKVIEQELVTKLHHHLEELPKRCHEIFCMSRMEHLSNQEIADRLGISKRTVENQITNALKHLRGHLSELTLLICAVCGIL